MIHDAVDYEGKGVRLEPAKWASEAARVIRQALVALSWTRVSAGVQGLIIDARSYYS